jgi:hypothetical protein
MRIQLQSEPSRPFFQSEDTSDDVMSLIIGGASSFEAKVITKTNPTIPLFSAAAGMGQGITLIAINPDSGIIEPAFNPIEVPGNDQRQTHCGRNARLQRGEDS